jgi:hypothetical protein
MVLQYCYPSRVPHTYSLSLMFQAVKAPYTIKVKISNFFILFITACQRFLVA